MWIRKKQFLTFFEKGPALAAARSKKSNGKSRRVLRKQPDSLDSVDSGSTISYVSTSPLQPSTPSRLFRLRSKSPASTQEPVELDSEEKPRYTSRGTFNPEKGIQKLRGSKYSPQRTAEEHGHKRDPDLQPQHLVLYGTNEFMV